MIDFGRALWFLDLLAHLRLRRRLAFLLLRNLLNCFLRVLMGISEHWLPFNLHVPSDRFFVLHCLLLPSMLLLFFNVFRSLNRCVPLFLRRRLLLASLQALFLFLVTSHLLYWNGHLFARPKLFFLLLKCSAGTALPNASKEVNLLLGALKFASLLLLLYASSFQRNRARVHEHSILFAATGGRTLRFCRCPTYITSHVLSPCARCPAY